MSATKI
jgi:hypothetical protein